MKPSSLLYVLQLTLAAIILHKPWKSTLGSLSAICFGLQLWFYRPLPILEPHLGPSSSAGLAGVSLRFVGIGVAFALPALLITYFIGIEMVRRIEKEALALKQQLSNNARLASLVTLTVGAAHELGTPLATIAVVAKELEHCAERAAGLVKDSQLIRSEVERCRLILRQMSARGAETVLESPVPVSLTVLLGRVAEGFPGTQQGLLHLDAAPNGPPVTLPVQGTVQALLALTKNALEANTPGCSIVIRAEQAEDRIRFIVRDRGHGMAPEVLNRIAKPFFTTKEAGGGMGLGVFLARVFAEGLGGQLHFQSTVGAGTTAALELPLLQRR